MKYKSFVILMLSLLFGALTSSAEKSMSHRFNEAQKAYLSKEYKQAISLYTEIEQAGFKLPEVNYNLGNAYFKTGNLPEAVLHYRKAWYAAPRDADIQTNLKFTLNAAGAAYPSPSIMDHFFSPLSKSEWGKIALGAYVSIFIFLVLAQLIRPARSLLRKISLLPLLLLFVAAGGWFYWHQYTTHPEAVIVTTDATTRYTPVDGSTAHFRIPFAAIVRIQRANNEWVRVEYNHEVDWLKRKHIKTILP